MTQGKLQRIIFIVGPTAVGKTDIAYSLAKKINGEIISIDSMQVYREVNIANAKPAAAILKGIRHHLINIVSIEDEFDVSRFVKMANEAISEVLGEKKTPILVGGTGLYFQILLDGIFEGKGKDEALREILNAEAKAKGNDYLYAKLVKMDEEAARRIHPNNLKRVIRALEVCSLEQQPFSDVRKKRKGIWGKYDIKIFGIDCSRDILYQKINSRVDTMFEMGLVDEINKVAKHKVSLTAQAMIGLKEVLRYLDGKCTLEQAKDKMKLNTRHYAKRQMTWFRRDKRIEWIKQEPHDKINFIADKIIERIN